LHDVPTKKYPKGCFHESCKPLIISTKTVFAMSHILSLESLLRVIQLFHL
jgi:hypothetical protein